jgi:hypothetical protein
MTQNTNEPAAQAEPSSEVPDNAQPAAKPRRPRRMARKCTAAAPPASSGAVAPDTPTNTPATPKSESKIARVIVLLSREHGATLAELVEATGWLPHTTRAALTGLRKKGRSIEKTKRGDATCYKLAESA